MTSTYIVTEGNTDIEILRTLLPKEYLEDLEFVNGKGSYSAQSLASTIVDVRRRSVALVLDADTLDEATVNEKKTFLYQTIRPTKSHTFFEVFIAVPEIEILFFHDKGLLEDILGKKISDAEWAFSKVKPRKYLEEVLGLNNGVASKLLQRIDSKGIKILQNQPFISDMTDFLSKINSNITTP